jgi:aryl carrier-like protein
MTKGRNSMSGHAEDPHVLVLSLARDLLERADVSMEDDFFAAGGDSMLAMHLVGRLARETGLRLRVTLLFAHPVLGEFAEQVGRLRRSEPAAHDISLASAFRSAAAPGAGERDAT